MIMVYVEEELRREGASQPMFAKSRKEKVVGQAHGLVHDLTEAITPHVERARDEIAPRLSDARDQIAPRLNEARDQIAPRLNEARDQIAPRLNEARDQLAPHVEDVRDRLVKGAATATAAAAPVAVEARRRGVLAAAALKGEPVKQKTSKKKKFLVVATLAGLGALAMQKLRGGDESTNWQSSYSPTPAPATSVPTPTATAGSHVADVPTDSATGSDDFAGANPGESLSDAIGEPHPVTLPDAPAEDVDVSELKDPKP